MAKFEGLFIIEGETEFIIDDSILKIAIEVDKDNPCEYIIAYLDYLKIKAYVTPTTYNKIIEKTKDKSESREYLRGHIMNGAELIGEDNESEEEELIALAENLVTTCERVLIISEELNKNEKFKGKIAEINQRIILVDLTKLNRDLTKNNEFWDYFVVKYLHTNITCGMLPTLV